MSHVERWKRSHPRKRLTLVIQGTRDVKNEEIEAEMHVQHGVYTRYCRSIRELAKFVVSFTLEISFMPYRKKFAFTTFYEKNKRCGKTVKEVWEQQLTQITGVSEAIAGAITQHYPSLDSLISVYYDRGRGKKEKEGLLENILVRGERDRRVGPVVSKRVYRVFTENSPDMIVQ